MFAFKGVSVAALLTTFLAASTVSATPIASPNPAAAAEAALKVSDKVARQAASSYWLANVKRQGTTNFAPSGYKLFRNVVTDFGADPSGKTDSSAAINNAISSGGRCGQGCDSSTATPAIIYFPAGTYLVKSPIVQYYYTQLIGDATNPPTIKADPKFAGIAVIDSDPYDNQGNNWFTNQNNFYRQIRNFKIDLTGLPATTGTGIHWQVAQATSLQNIVFNMVPGAGSKQQGIFMDNGSGGFISNLTFNGGGYGAFFGSQQFTTRNLVFNNVQTAIFMNWNWGWTLAGIQVNGGQVALDMSNAPTNQTVGSVILMDSKITSAIGVKTAWTNNPASVPNGGGSLVLDNVDFSACSTAVANPTGGLILAGNKLVKSWVQGRYYNSGNGKRMQGDLTSTTKSAGLLNPAGQVFTRNKPQYETTAAGSFVSIRSFGAVGDGQTDDTAAFQKAMASCTANQVLYIDHGAYIISSTINVPTNIKIVGEIWPMIFATGAYFSDQKNPKPVFKVGNAGQSGSVEMQDLVFQTKGPAPGAIMMQWNLKSAQGASGLWDVHFRIGGSAGTNLQSDKCSKSPTTQHGPNAACIGAFLLFHATPQSSNVYVENSWLWVADHELDLKDHNQIDIYNGRGVLIESAGSSAGGWYWGTAAEHSTLYNYQLNKASNVFMGFIQSETPYFQTNPSALVPFTPNVTGWADPNFTICAQGQKSCQKSWGLRVQGGSGVHVYGAGLYSFFENYAQDCVSGQNCQTHMVSVQSGAQNVNLFALSTKAAVNMVTLNGKGVALDSDNRSNFCATLAGWAL